MWPAARNTLVSSPQSVARSPQSECGPQPAARNLWPATRSPQSVTRNPQPAMQSVARNPQPAARNLATLTSIQQQTFIHLLSIMLSIVETTSFSHLVKGIISLAV